MKRVELLLPLLIGVLAVSVMAQPALQVGNPAPNFNLKDQFDRTWNLNSLRGQVVLLVVADKDSGRLMDPWFSNLKMRYAGKAQIIGLLDLHGVPGIGRGIARSRIRKETSDPMILDFGGSVGRTYGANSKVPVVVVIDKGGIVRGIARTTYNSVAYANIVKPADAALAAK